MEVGTTPHESVQMLSAKTVLGFAGIMGWTLFFSSCSLTPAFISWSGAPICQRVIGRGLAYHVLAT